MTGFWVLVGRLCADESFRDEIRKAYREEEQKWDVAMLWELSNEMGLRSSLFEIWEVARMISHDGIYTRMKEIGSYVSKEPLGFTANEFYEILGVCSIDYAFARQMHEALSSAERRNLVAGYGLRLSKREFAKFESVIGRPEALRAMQFINDESWDYPCDEARFFHDAYDERHWYGDAFDYGFLYGAKLRKFREEGRNLYISIMKEGSSQ